MKPILVTDDIYRLTVNAKDLLFEQMWEIPNGVTLNSYLVKGEKLALVDGVCGWDGVPEQLFDLLDQMDVKLEDVDYVIINHMEPDHSGWLEDLRSLKPDVQIYCTRLGQNLLRAFFGITEGVNVIKNGDTLDLGNGKVLQFFQQPNVHWPDTMFTLEQSTSTLFTCDMFGSYGVCEDNHFDDEFSDEDRAYFWEEQIRYYSTVLVTFNKNAIMAINKTKTLEPKIIAPGHGPVYRQSPNELIENYQKIANFVNDTPLDEVTVLWGSMYGMTEKAVEHIKALLEAKNIKYNICQMPQTPLSLIMNKCIRAKAIIVAAPTYENNLFPGTVAVLEELGKKKITNKKALYVGSFGWSGGGYEEVERILEHHKLNWQLAEPVTFNGTPLEEDLAKVTEAVDKLLA